MRTRHELTPVVAAAQALCAPELVHSLRFSRLATGALSYEGVALELLAFKRAFERSLWRGGLPIYASELGASWVRFVHLDRGADLTVPEWAVIAGLGLEAARQVEVDVSWRAAVPSLWALAGVSPRAPV